MGIGVHVLGGSKYYKMEYRYINICTFNNHSWLGPSWGGPCFDFHGTCDMKNRKLLARSKVWIWLLKASRCHVILVVIVILWGFLYIKDTEAKLRTLDYSLPSSGLHPKPHSTPDPKHSHLRSLELVGSWLGSGYLCLENTSCNLW